MNSTRNNPNPPYPFPLFFLLDRIAWVSITCTHSSIGLNCIFSASTERERQGGSGEFSFLLLHYYIPAWRAMDDESNHPNRMNDESHQDGSAEIFEKERGPGNKIGISEGADLYGDISTAEGYGYVSRGYDAMGNHIRPTAD